MCRCVVYVHTHAHMHVCLTEERIRWRLIKRRVWNGSEEIMVGGRRRMSISWPCLRDRVRHVKGTKV